MVSNCANPKCSAVFRYLQEGRLFRHEVLYPRNDPGEGSEFSRNGRRIEFFWLCADCASRMTLVFRDGTPTLEPLVRVRAASAD